MLYPHQPIGAEWLAQRSRAGLFDDTGLGKTVTAIAGARLAGVRRMLVLVPAIVLWNWRNELAQHWPEATVQVIETGADEVREDVVAVIATHGMLVSERMAGELRGRKWDLLVVDEVHYFRGPTAKRSQVLYGLRDPAEVGFVPPALIASCERVWVLTATPIPNNASELWTHYCALWPAQTAAAFGGRLPTHAQWVAKFCRTRPTLYGVKVIGNKNVGELRQLIGGTFLRRLKKDVLKDLPPIRYEVMALRPDKLPWELVEVEARIKPAALKAAKEDVGENGSAAAAWSALKSSEDYARFRQLCGIAKVGPVSELLTDELESGALDKVFVAAHHLAVIEGIEQRLHKFGTVVITGGVPKAERQRRIDRFQTDPAVRVFVGQLAAAGVGATLTAAAEGVFVEMSFVPGENTQVADRIHRIGQTRSVRVRFISLAGTADEDVTASLRNKIRARREILT